MVGCGVKNNTSGNNIEQKVQFVVNYLEPEINNYQDENAEKEYELEFNGETYLLQYKKTRELPARRAIHQYRTDNITLQIVAKTGEISLVTSSQEPINCEKKLTEKEIREKVDSIASRYIDIDDFSCKGGVNKYDDEKYKYIYKRYHKDLVLTGWIEIEVDIYGNEKAIVLNTVQNNETDKGLEMIDKDTIEEMDKSVIEKAIEKAEGTVDFRVNQRESIEVDGETRLLYFVDAYDDNGKYAGFSWLYEVVWE